MMNIVHEEFFYALDKAAIMSAANTLGKIIFVNDKFCQISGYSREELIGQNHALLNSRTHSKHFFANMWQTIQAGEIWVGEICNKAKDGHLYWVNSSIIPIIDTHTQCVSKYISIRFDITQRKIVEQRLNQIQNKFESALEGFLVEKDLTLPIIDTSQDESVILLEKMENLLSQLTNDN